MSPERSAGYELPPYPYDRLHKLRDAALERFGACLDLSIGTPSDAPPAVALKAMATAGAERGYPPSVGIAKLRAAACGWLERSFGVALDPTHVAATVGTKEFVVSTPRYLQLRSPERDTVLYPAISYPSYAMGAELAGLRAVPVPVDEDWRLQLDAIGLDDAARALCLWVNSPGNPAGGVEDLGAVANWGRQNGVLVISDECYVEFTWRRARSEATGRHGGCEGNTIIECGPEGVLALHSLSKRSNFAGGRCGFYCGDPEIVHFLSEVRKHGGHMVPGPIQHGAAALLDDDAHVRAQRQTYLDRLKAMQSVLGEIGLKPELPEGGFYLWVHAPDGDAWRLAEHLAVNAGVLVSPGEFYGAAGSEFIRLALVAPLEGLASVGERLAGTRKLVAG